MSDYRVEIKVKNNNILRKINQAGYKTVGEFCRLNPEIKSDVSNIGELVNLKMMPIGSDGKFRPCVLRIAEVLCCSPEDLFSDAQMTTAMETNTRAIEVKEAELKFMLSNKPEQKMLEDIMMDQRLPNDIDKILDTLTKREQHVVRMRFGLPPFECAHTLEEISATGGIYGDKVSKDTVRMALDKALRKMRHPTRSKMVIEHLRNEDDE